MHSILLALFLLAGPVANDTVKASSVVERLAGVYKARFRNADVSGREFQSENILEIVPYGTTAAYVRISLNFFNGHTCGAWGVATVIDQRLLYEAPERSSGSRCRFEIVEKEGIVLLRDVSTPEGSAECKVEHCGMRGSLQGEWPANSRRTIRYMKRLVASPEYAAAVTEYESGRSAR